MKKTAKRFSLGVKIASILTCLVITAVGFASWLVVKPVEATDNQGSFTVYAVDSVDVELTITPVVSTVVFGKTDSSYNDPWVVAEGVANQVLTASFKVDVAAIGSDGLKINSVVDKIKVSFDIKDVVEEKFHAAIGRYIAAPKVTVNGGTSYQAYNNGVVELEVAAANASTQTFNVDIVFGWGSITGGENPYDYYNGQTATTELADEAEDFLKNIYLINSALTGEDRTAFTLVVDAQ